MHTFSEQKKDRNPIDNLLYILVGSVITVISFSFLLWLRF